MTKGHLDQTRINVRSTKTNTADTEESTDAIYIPTTQQEERCHYVYATCTPITGQVFTDQTGKFGVTSVQGHNYVLVLYDYDSNAILAEPMKTRTGQEHKRAYEHLHQYLVKRGLRPQLQRLDNEASDLLKEYMGTEQVTYQLTPAGDHRRNAAERAIRTLKNHLIAMLAGADPNFPAAL